MMRLLYDICDGDDDGYFVVHLSRMRNQTEKDVGMQVDGEHALRD